MDKYLLAVLTAVVSVTATGCLQEDAASANTHMANSRVYIGALTCDIGGSTGYVVGSKKDLACTFETLQGEVQPYAGKIQRVGLDLGYTKPTRMMWKVFSFGSNRRSNALNGTFVGSNSAIILDTSTSSTWLYGGNDGAAVLQGATLFDGRDAGYNIQYGVAAMTLAMTPKAPKQPAKKGRPSPAPPKVEIMTARP